MKTLFATLVAVFAADHAVGAPICGAASLSTYLGAGFECEINAVVFTNFDFFLQNDTSDTVALTPDEITVTPLDLAGQAGFRFSGDFGAVGNPNGPGPAQGITNITYRFFFDLTRPGSLITEVSSALNNPLRFAPNPLKFGDIFASNQAANDGAVSIANDDDPDLSDADPLNKKREEVSADLLLVLSAGASAEGTLIPVGTVSLSSADYLYSYEVVIPEPGTWAMLGISAGLLAFLRRHQL